MEHVARTPLEGPLGAHDPWNGLAVQDSPKAPIHLEVENLENLQDDPIAGRLSGPHIPFVQGEEPAYRHAFNTAVTFMAPVVLAFLSQLARLVAILLMHAAAALYRAHGYLEAQANSRNAGTDHPHVDETGQSRAQEAKVVTTVVNIQCACCSLEHSPASIIRCLSGHAACFGCFSRGAAIQNSRDVICQHDGTCGVGFKEGELERLPEGVLWQLAERGHKEPEVPQPYRPVEKEWEGISGQAVYTDTRGDNRTDMDDGAATDVEDEDEQEDTRRRQDSSFRLEQAIFQCTIALGKDTKDGGLEVELADKRHHREVDNNSDVEDYASSASALARLGKTPLTRTSSGRTNSVGGASFRHEGAD